MKSFAWLRARPRTFASVAVIAAGAIALTTLAFVYQGNPTTEVDLNDGSVWVTKESSLLVGHFNHESRVLDGGLRAGSDQYDILQSGDTVLLHDESGHAITSVDPATVALTNSADIPASAQVVLGGSTVAVLDTAKGSLWVIPAGGVSGFKAASTRPVAKLGEGSAVTVGTDGTVYAVSARKKQLVTVPVDQQGTPRQPSTAGLDKLGAGAKVSITVVGSTPVVLDSASGTVLNASGLDRTLKGGQSAALQQPSTANDAVMVSTSSALLRVPLDGSDPTSRSAGAEGIAAAPVYLNGCSYAAWSVSAKYLRDCPGSADDMAMDVPGADDKTKLTFRVNRDVVVLNDIIGGSAWMASDSMQQVDNWDDLTPPKGDTEDNDETVTEQTVQNTLPKRTEKNTPPIANDDSFGVRPGRTTILPVLDNDTDADGDVLTVSVPNGDPRIGALQAINNGSGLQIAVPADASGAANFAYDVDDGRGGHASANVQLDVHGWNVNAAPTQKRVTALTIESGGVLTYNVLSDWIDPDGDNLFLKSAEAAPGDEAEVSSDGRITYRALSGTLGRKDVKIVVSDGEKVTEGTVRFDVRPQGSTEPVTTADHVIAHVGQPITVSPLVNDISSSSQELRLTRVDEVAGATVTPDFPSRTFTFVSKGVGTYYVQYLVSAGSASANGIVRVDVVPDKDSDLPPVAVRDVALLPSGRDVLVNVLANDSDPAGGILVVQSVSVPQNSGISVAVLNHETLRVSDQGTLDQQVTIAYTISNGRHSATGQVVVIPVPAPSTLRPPVANDDSVVVRAGDIVTIPVLDNDVDPNGGTLHVAPALVPPLVAPKDGEAFVSQDTVRFRASDKPGTVYLTYEAVDATGQKDAGYVTIQVLPVNRATNTAPRPKDITARVLSGSEVRIPVPLDGIDADGDSVDLVGIASAPAKGSVVETGADYLVYKAIGSATGVDTFSYRVRDRLGKEGTATVRVGIAPAASVNQAPYAVKDTVVMRPGRSVAVPVLTNDSDPEGDAIGLVENGLVLPKVAGLTAKVVGDRVEVTAPDSPVETSLQYTIRDARGAEAVAVLQISVKKDVPLLAPIARDDRVRAEDIKDDAVDVDVLANDEDPDGTTSALKVTAEGSTAKVLSGGKVRVQLTGADQLVTYTLTDQDGLTASAFIHVPSKDGLPPTLISTKAVTVKSGETKQLPLAQYVRVSNGKTAVITEADKVVAVHGDGSDLVKDQSTLVYTSAKNYYGPDAITFEVTDGTGPDDPKGHKATLVLPITVVPPDNVQPTFVNGQMQVAPGEDAAGLDLRPLTTDPDQGDLARMQYSIIGGVPSGFSASIDGQVLKVKAGADTRKGSVATIALSITDGETAPIEGTVSVKVTASTRPLATANDDIIPEAHQGDTILVPVLDNDFNPFPDKPLKVVSAVTETGDGVATVSGDRVSVTPSKSFVGRMVVQYRVQDATGDPDREVQGRIELTVQGVPGTPGKPTVSSVQDRTVVLSWTPPADNGAEITKYTVKSLAGGYSKVCQATTCTLDGLTNNVEYNFTVVATNRVGDSPASPPSETARPDARPDTPQAPTLAFGDRSLKVAWVTPSTPGSPVESFNLEISPAPPSGIVQKTGVKGNSLTWDGLENGVAYQVRVQAVNRAPEPSSWSAWSATEIPASAPDAPGQPSTQRLSPVGSQAQMQVSWNQPADNGGPISGYQLDVMQGSSVVRTIPVAAGTTSQAVVMDTSTTDYVFRVRAENKAGWGAYSPTSAPRRAFTAPGAPTITSADPGDRKITVTYTPAQGNGANANEMAYEYSVNGGTTWSGNWDGHTITGLTNGTSYTVRVRAYTSLDGTRYDGAVSNASQPVVPFGVPGTPGANATASGTNITFTWSAPNNNGATIDQTRIRFDGGSWQSVNNNGSTTRGYGNGETHTIEVQAHNKAGWGGIGSDSARTADPPSPSARVSRGASHNSSTCTSSACADFKVTTSDFPAGNHSVSCNATGPYGGTPFRGPYTVNLPANGSVSLPCYFGDAGEQVWVTIDGKAYERSTW